jgi:Family of unknown function (DUF6157)
MKTHTTNYYNTFIEIAEDCPVLIGEIPPINAKTKTVANIQFELINNNPYQFTSDDILFQVYAHKKDLSNFELNEAREEFFSKGQPCFRASPLTKRYGWGVHYDKDGKIAIYAANSPEYEKFSKDENLKVIKAMKSKK